MRVKLWAFKDRTYSFKIKPPPTSWMLKRASGVNVGAAEIETNVGMISIKCIYEIAKIKKELDPDLRNVSLDGICSMIIAQSRGMGLRVMENVEHVELIAVKTKGIR
eukprot:TRINITY_DN3200_c0_g5_i1.p1 TRINITY_DN3200_c0_g5~~TRINITY_DN3200_c0_g5_i1.p1  ORF type:complete len:107 (-),score=21.20 TRINITY_DN3200_c0_g5_i1:64-384(-)